MYVCADCSKVFTRKDNLHRHMHKHNSTTTHVEDSHQSVDHEDHQNYPSPRQDEDGWTVLALPKMIHSFTCMVAGPTGCGKTTFIKKLLEFKEEKIFNVPSRVVWCYTQWQPLYAVMEGVEFHQGLPDIEDLESCLVILDDMMSQLGGEVTEVFTQGSHHRQVSVIAVVQNIFHQSKHQRTMSLNTHYMILLKNPRDASQIQHLARQMYPQNPRFLVDVFNRVTSLKPFSYLFLDLKQETPESLRLRANVLEEEERLYQQ